MVQHAGRIVVFGVLVVAIAALGALAATPWLSVSLIQQRIAQERQTLAGLDLQIADTRSVRGSEHGDDEKVFRSLLLAGSTPGIAGANLQKLANDLAVGHGSHAQSIQILAPKVEGALTHISVRLSITSSTEALREILYKLETNRPLIFVESLTVRIPQKDQQTTDRYYSGPLEVIMQLGVYAVIEKAS
jgi:general secretion pathway protein M